MSTNRAITINQQYQAKLPSKSQSNRVAEIFPDAITNQSQQINPLQSIATVLSQALSTKDQQVIQQLLITSAPQTIKNTVAQLQPSRLSALLEAIQKILLQDAKNTKSIRTISAWLSELLKKNIGHIINNAQLQIISGRISRIIKKRVSALSTLHTLNAQIKYRQQPSQASNSTKYVPKFHYIQEQNQIVHRQGDEQDKISEQFNKKKQQMSDISDIGPQDLQNMDEMLMNDDMDLEM